MNDNKGYFVPWARKYHPSHPKVSAPNGASLRQAEDPEAIAETVKFCESMLDRYGAA